MSKKLKAAVAAVILFASLGGSWLFFKDWMVLSPADQQDVQKFIQQYGMAGYMAGKQSCKNTI